MDMKWREVESLSSPIVLVMKGNVRASVSCGVPTAKRHNKELHAANKNRWHLGHACHGQMVLDTRFEEWLFTGWLVPEWQGDVFIYQIGVVAVCTYIRRPSNFRDSCNPSSWASLTKPALCTWMIGSLSAENGSRILTTGEKIFRGSDRPTSKFSCNCSRRCKSGIYGNAKRSDCRPRELIV
jgi:hypothetical protein